MTELKMLFKLLIYVDVMNSPSLFGISTAVECNLLGSVHAPEDKEKFLRSTPETRSKLLEGEGETLGTLPNLHAYRGKETYLSAN